MKNVITVSREYGSGGYEIGQRVADALGYTFYDKDLIAQIADKIMVSPEVISKAEDKAVHKNIFIESLPLFAYPKNEEEDYIFTEQGKFIVSLAGQGNCVIAGRRADYYLRDNPNALHLFFYADMDYRIARICKTDGLTPEEAAKKIEETDKKRKMSYEYTTGRKWADRHNYDRMICTSTVSIEKCVEEIVNLCR